jgi:hypothetical protein
MALTDAAQRQHYALRSVSDAVLIGVYDRAWIEKRRCLERIFFSQVGAGKQHLLEAYFLPAGMPLHQIVVAPQEEAFDIAMAMDETRTHACKLGLEVRFIEAQDSLKDALNAGPPL